MGDFNLTVVYLHGFASSAKSSKAAFFAARLAPHNISLRIPDFNEPDFEHLTITRMIGQVREAIAEIGPGASVALIGSSLGAFVALHAAARQNDWKLPVRIERLVLLAPALDFGGNLTRLGEQGVARWKETDRLEVFHHGFGRMMPVRYALNEDAASYDSFSLRLDLPTLIFQGSGDDTVDPAVVHRWAEGRVNVTLRLLDDGHQLLSSLDRIWAETFSFLRPDHSSECTAVR